jgi:hypothetical protein
MEEAGDILFNCALIWQIQGGFYGVLQILVYFVLYVCILQGIYFVEFRCSLCSVSPYF